MPPRISSRAAIPSARSSAIASIACIQRLSGVKRPILKARQGVPAACRIAAAARGSGRTSALSGMPLGITTGLTPQPSMSCFM